MRVHFALLRAHESASPRLATSMIIMPPTNSLARVACAQAAGESGDARGIHFAVESVDSSYHGFIKGGGIKVFGEISRDHKVRHHHSPELSWAVWFDPPSLLQRTMETDSYKATTIFSPLWRPFQEGSDLDGCAAGNASFLAPVK
jgi:hypothetical protein